MPDAAVSLRSVSAQAAAQPTAPVSLARILVAIDASDHANRALTEAARLAAAAGGTITGIHAYAARLHDQRFRQMEGGLPSRYREESELERQREVHDSLITRGLSIIGDSYHDAGEQACAAAKVPYRRLSPEGKNYRRVCEAAASGEFDLVALGARGLGATPDSPIGTVCVRVARRSPVDILVIRDNNRSLNDGPLVVGVDGSQQSFGALRTAIDIGRRLGAPVHAVAAYDPYFHYVAFQRIAGVLSEKAGRIFRFKEQEKLHEEIIDDGLAKIYAAHLEVARAVARADGAELVTRLLDGKPYQAINRYLAEVGASAVFVGKIGIHADAELDIGGTTENLLRLAACHVWIGAVTYTPPLDAVASETIVWSAEAEEKIARVPETVRSMVRMVILRYVQEQGHTVVTSALVDQATARFCPSHSKGSERNTCMPQTRPVETSVDTRDGALAVADSQLRAEQRSQTANTEAATADRARLLPSAEPHSVLTWTAAALARLSRVPVIAREAVRTRTESRALGNGETEVTAPIIEATIAESCRAMASAMQAGGHKAPAQPSE